MDRSLPALTRVVALMLAGIGLAAGVAIIGVAPALSPGLREAGLFGDWRTVRSASLYDASDYAFDTGFAYLQADLVFADATEMQDAIADPATAAERAAEARRLLERAVALAPANGRAWAALAWSRALDGDPQGAIDAAETSWTLAPNSTFLASQRLPLYALLSGEPGADRLKSGATRDAAALQRFLPRYFNAAFGDDSVIAPLIRTD